MLTVVFSLVPGILHCHSARYIVFRGAGRGEAQS
jgi:hypothetical protein